MTISRNIARSRRTAATALVAASSMLLAAAALTPAPAAAEAAAAGTVTLEGTLRDFKKSHPDMEFRPTSFGRRSNMVERELDEDGLPVMTPWYRKNSAYAMVQSVDTFNQWFRNVPGVNVTETHSITLEPHPSKPGVMYFAREVQGSGPKKHFFPADGRGFNEKLDAGYGPHNYFFTFHLETRFVYDDPAGRDHDLTFEFSGDDDVWVFINNRLAIDIGGVHGQQNVAANLDQRAADLGLVPGETYPLTLFFAERHTQQSNFRIETTLKLEGLPPSTISATYD